MSKSQAELMVELGGALNALLVASRAVAAASAERFCPSLQAAAYQLAVALWVGGPAKAGRLADLLGMDKSAVSRLAKSLCDNGLAEASADPADGRGVIFSLTEDGRERVQCANTVKSDAFLARIKGWSDAELMQFISLLRKFNQI